MSQGKPYETSYFRIVPIDTSKIGVDTESPQDSFLSAKLCVDRIEYLSYYRVFIHF